MSENTNLTEVVVEESVKKGSKLGTGLKVAGVVALLGAAAYGACKFFNRGKDFDIEEFDTDDEDVFEDEE